MEIPFQKQAIGYLKTILHQQKKEEYTYQIRLTDSMPDIGRVLGCWGQILIRGKEWRSDYLSVTGGVMAWVLYQPEDNSEPCAASAWIPFQMKWEIEECERDGSIEVCTSLGHIDARMLSDRKLIVRANICAQIHAVVSEETDVCVPTELPDGVQVLQNAYPMVFPVEAGEKGFEIEQQLDIPQDAARIKKVIRFESKPVLNEYKIVADKLVLRGTAEIYVLYVDDLGRFCNETWQVPFSQYAQLDREYEPTAEVTVCFEVTQVELEIVQPDALNLKLSFTAQYTVFSLLNITVIEDMYSLKNEIKADSVQISLPNVMQLTTQSVQVGATAPEGRVLDVAVNFEMPAVIGEEETFRMELAGNFQILFEDAEGQLQAACERWQKSVETEGSRNFDYEITPIYLNVPNFEKETTATLEIKERIITAEPLNMIRGAEIGELIEPDPFRPSIVLRRSGTESLWEIAKSVGSTEELIRKANGLKGDLDENQMLLIPIQ